MLFSNQNGYPYHSKSRYDYNKDYIYAFGDYVCAERYDHDYEYSPYFDYNIYNKLLDLNDHDF
jgi:hypothetical protein